MAVLRIALSLIVVLCFAAPAAAQFATSDLNGLWNIQGAETVGNPAQDGGFVLGNILFNVQGGVLGGSIVDSHGITEFLFDEGSITVNTDGTLSGTVGDDEGTVQVQGRMLPGKQVIVAVTTGNPGSQNPSYTIVVLVKNASLDPPLFSQADVTGAWRSASLLVPELPAFVPETLDGTITFDDEGGIGSGTLRSSNGPVSTAITGNLFVVGNGFFSGAFSIDLGATVDVSSFEGYMSPDKSLLAGITIRNRPGPGLVQNGILVLERRPAPSVSFANADAVGRWDLFSLHGLNNQGNEGQWLVGNIVVGSGGLITSGTLTGPGGEQDAVVDLDDDTSNRLAIDSTGAVTGNIVTELRILDLRGVMNAAKNRIVGVDGLQEEARQVGFFTLLKADATAPPPASTVQFRATSVAPRVAEGGTAALVVERSGATTTTVTVQYSVTGGTATPGSDFNVVSGTLTSTTGTLTFERGELTKTINVIALPDTAIEGDETVNLALTNPTGGAVLGSRATSVVTIGDGAAVQFQQPVYSVKENVASAVITVVRTGASTTPFTVTYTATPLTPGREGDFKIPSPSVLTFAAGVLTRTISVTIVNNTLVDGNRSVLLSLGQPTNGTQLGPQSTTTLNIQDDDLAGSFKVDKPTYTVAESAGSVPIIVRRLGTSLAGGVTVDYFTVDGTATSEGTPRDYASQSGTLTFKAGETMKTVAIPVFKDNLVDGPKTFTFRLRLSEPSSGGELVEGQSSALVTITDVDLPGVIKFVPDKYSVSENARNVTLTVQRTGGLGGGVLVDFATADGTAIGGSREEDGDFKITSGTLSFGFGSTSTTITIPIHQDTQAEGNESFTVVLSNARTQVGPLALPAVGKVATVTIVDDESAFQFSAPTLSVKEGTPSAVITVLRTGTLTAPATVTYTATPDTAQPGTDFTAVSGALTFAANVPSKTFNVPILNNTRLDGARRVRLALGTPTGGAQLGTVRTAILTIEDNEQAGTFRLDKGAYTVLETAGFVTVNVLRSGLNLTGNVSVNLVATDGTAKTGINYGAPPTTLIFGPGEITKPVKVPILRDFVVTGPGPQKFTLTLSEPSSGATLGTPASATVTITEADVAGQVKFSAASYVVNESAGSAVLTVVRTGGTAGGVLVEFTTVDGTAVGGSEGDFTTSSGILTFGAGNTSATISVPITSDTISEGNESFQVRLQNPTGGATLGSPATATVTIMDDDSSMVQFSGNFIGNFPEVIRIGNLSNEVLVDFAGIDGTAIGGLDYRPISGTITFKANTRAATIPLVIVNDPIAEGNETFAYVLRNPRGARLGPDSQKTFVIQDNDFGGSDVQFTAPSYTASEGQAATLTVTRTGGLGTILVVQWSAGEGTATPGVDFSPASGNVTFGVNDQRASFTINLLADALVEGTETVPITLTMPDAAATLGAQTTAILQIQDVAPPASVVQFTAPTFSSALGQDKPITLARTGALGTPLTVNWTATGGSAVAGEDFSPSQGVVTFGPTDTSASFTISIRGSDGNSEPDRTAVFGLSIASGAATIGAVNPVTLTIFGSPSGLNLEFSVFSVTEGGGPAIVTVTRSGNLNRQVTVNYATSNGTAVAGTHYAATSGTLTVPAGDDTATFTVPIISNGPGDGTRTVNLRLSNPSPNTSLGEGDTSTLQIREGPVYTFKLIAETDDQVIGFDGAPGINDGGTVALKALLSNGQRILTGSGGSLTTIASTGDRAIVEFGSRTPIDSAGNVVFLAGVDVAVDNGIQTIFRGDGESLTALVGTTGQTVQLFEPALSRNGTLVFAGQPPQGGLRLFSGTGSGPFPLVPGTDGGAFVNVGTHPAVNDDGLVAFTAIGNDVPGIFTVAPGGAPETLASQVDVGTVTNVSINDAGRVAFINGTGNIKNSVLIAQTDSSVSPLARQDDGFQTFGDQNTESGDASPVINDRGDVAFLALTQAGSFGILTGPSPVGNMAIQVGDPLLGSNVQSLTVGGINGSGQIVFRASLLDGREVVVVATPPAALTDLAVTKTVNTPSPFVGSNVTFTVTATNNGPSAAPSVTVTDLLPSGYTFVSATPSKGTYTAGTGVWSVGALAASGAGRTATLVITATVRATGTYTNTATIAAVGITDTNAANNSATATVTPALQTDIAVTKTVNTPSPVIGSNVIFTLTVTNNGPAAATGVQVTDLLPSGYTFVSSTPGQGTYTAGTGVWAVGSLAASGPSATAALQITAKVLATGNYANTATRTASTPADTNAANDSATASVSPISGVALTTDGPLVGVGRTINGAATIPAPAPAAGVTITLDSSPAGRVTIVPTTVVIPQGQTSRPFTVTGVAAGPTTISGTSPGFGPGSVDVTVTNSAISLGTLPALGPGQTTSLPTSLSTTAPASGVTVTFVSSNPSVATVSQSVFIPGGAQVPAANPQVTAVGVGTAQINATAIGFAPDSRGANVSVSVTFTPTTLSVVAGATNNITVNIAAAAPSNGLTLALATANTNIARVVSPVTIPAGQLSAQAAVTGVTAGQNTTLHATGTGVTSTTATISVTQPPGINFANQTIGRDLELQVSVSLATAAPAGGVQLTVAVPAADANRLLVSTSGTAQGSGQVVLSVPAGAQQSPTPLFIQALASTGTVQVTASAPGYTSKVATITLGPSGFVINPFSIGTNFTTTSLSTDTSLQLLPSLLSATFAFVTNQTVRGGLTSVTVPVTAADLPGGGNTVGTIVGSPAVFNGGDSSKNVAFHPIAAGVSQIQVNPPPGFNFSTPSNARTPTATVSTPGLNIGTTTVGRDLQVQGSVTLGAPAPTGGVRITLTSGDANRMLLSTSATAQGSGQIVLPVNVGASGSSTPFFIQALDGSGTVSLSASAPGYANQSVTITLGPSGFVFNPFAIGATFTTTTFSANTNLQILPALLAVGAAPTFATNQAVRGGLGPVNVTVSAVDQPTGGTSVGTIVGSPVTFNGGDTSKIVAFDPTAAGTSLITVEVPTGFNFTAPANARVITATVTAPAISFANQTIGRDLQLQVGVSLAVAAPTGGIQLTIRSADANRVALSTSGTAVGTGQVTLPITAGSFSSITPLFIQALDGSGTVQVTASAPGYVSQVATITLGPSGFVFNPFSIGSAFTTTTFSPNTALQIVPALLNATGSTFVSNQALRGGLTVSVPVTAVDQPTGGSSVGTIVGSPATFNPGDTFKNVTFDPAAAGTSQITVGLPPGSNFVTPGGNRVITATVTAPAITFNGVATIAVGQNLQTAVSVTLAATPPGPVTVTLTVASTAIATIVSSANATLDGSNTVTFTNVTSTNVGTFVVQARTASGGTTITAQAAGYADGVLSVTTQPSGFIINSPGNFTTTAGAVNTSIQIVAARLNANTLNFEVAQPVRGGLTVSVPVTAVAQSGSGVGTITTSPLVFSGNQSALSTQFDPAAAGTSLISVGLPTGFNPPSNFRQITATVN